MTITITNTTHDEVLALLLEGLRVMQRRNDERIAEIEAQLRGNAPAAPAAPAAPPSKPGPRAVPGKRTMSEEGRAAIRAAQVKRWKAIKKAKKVAAPAA